MCVQSNQTVNNDDDDELYLIKKKKKNENFNQSGRRQKKNLNFFKNSPTHTHDKYIAIYWYGIEITCVCGWMCFFSMFLQL